MNMYTCPACKLAFDMDVEGSGCPRCAFPIIGDADDTPESRAALERKALNWRRKHWADGKVYLKVYSHAFTDSAQNEIACTGVDEICLGSTRALKAGECLWQNERFARLSGELTLELRIAQEDCEDTAYRLHLRGPGLRGFWQVGLRCAEEGVFTLCVGNEEQYSESERFFLSPRSGISRRAEERKERDAAFRDQNLSGSG